MGRIQVWLLFPCCNYRVLSKSGGKVVSFQCIYCQGDKTLVWHGHQNLSEGKVSIRVAISRNRHRSDLGVV